MNTNTTSSLVAFLTLLTIVISIIGLADASFITYEEYSGKIPVCGQGFDCGKVLSSPWAQIGPIPVSVFGMLFYATMLVLGVLHYLDAPIQQFRKFKQNSFTALVHGLDNAGFKNLLHKNQIRFIEHQFAALTWQRVAFTLTIPGVFFTLYLIFLMAFVINAWCLYCIISASSTISLFIVHSVLLKLSLK